MNKITATTLLVLTLLVSGAATAGGFEEVDHVGNLAAGIEIPIDLAISASGDLHVLDRAHRKVIVFDRELKPRMDFGEKGKTPGTLNEPAGIAVGRKGNVIVADAGNGLVHIFDADGKPITAFGGKGAARGRLGRPTRVLADAFGMIYVGDTENQTISLFSETGVFLDRIMLGEFHKKAQLVDFTVDAQANVYALLMPEGKILRTRFSSGHLRWIEPQGEKFLHRATGIAVDPRGDLYITVSKQNNIKKIDTAGTLLMAFGSKGKGPGQFLTPTRVAVDPEGRVAVIDSKNRRVQVLEVTGSTKAALDPRERSLPTAWLSETPKLFDGVSDLHRYDDGGLLALSTPKCLIVQQRDRTTVIGADGKAPGQFARPEAFAPMADGGIAVADTDNNRVQLMDAAGTFKTFGKSGKKPGRFDAPAGIAVSSDNKLYVADTGNHRIQIFNDQGIFLTSFGTKSKEKNVENGTFVRPTDVAIDSRDRILVVDSGNRRVQIFDSKGRFRNVIPELSNPVDIAVDASDNIYIGDAGCRCVRVFRADGARLMTFGSGAEGEGGIPALTAIAVGDGKVHVASEGHDELQVFEIALDGVRGKPSDRVDVTQTYYIPEEVPAGSADAATYRTAALAKALEQLAALLESSAEILEPLARIDAETAHGEREFRLTVSVPRDVPRVTAASAPDAEEPAAFELK